MTDVRSTDNKTITAGGAIFTRLKALGVDYVFANSGTDFPPIIEGLAEAAAKNIPLPQALVMPHENAAVGMAHGYYLATGRPQCVMLHTNVGLSNGATAAINAAGDHVPMILMSGRTPTMEGDRFGARTVPIGWGQEMRDQTALVREVSKWDYELRFPEQITEVLDRANAIACSTPKGPVYICLPREVLCETIDASDLDAPVTMNPVIAAPDASALADAARLLANAKRPLIIAQKGSGNTQESFDEFSQFVSRWALPVNQYWPIQMALPIGHEMAVGTAPSSLVEEADVILVIDSLAPWWPDKYKPQRGAKVIQLGPNPLFSRTPIRNFRADISLVGETGSALAALIHAMEKYGKPTETEIDQRRKKIQSLSNSIRGELRAKIALQSDLKPTTKDWVAQCLTTAIENHEATIFSELGVHLGAFEGSQAGGWFQEPQSGGLGWSFPAALGYKLARPEKLVIATMGDGSYMFANPTVCHQIAESLDLPIIVIILNNQEWGAVRNSVEALYPKGYAAKTNRMPLTALKPTPDFTKTAEASRAYVENVADSAAVPAALERAIKVAMNDKRPVLLNIAIS